MPMSNFHNTQELDSEGAALPATLPDVENLLIMGLETLSISIAYFHLLGDNKLLY